MAYIHTYPIIANDDSSVSKKESSVDSPLIITDCSEILCEDEKASKGKKQGISSSSNDSKEKSKEIKLDHTQDIPLVQIEFCNKVLKIVEQKLQSIQILQMSDLNVSLSHLSDAKLALQRNQMQRFQYFIEQSYGKAREAQHKVTDCVSKIYVYSLLLFNGFLIFSDFGMDFLSGLSYIQKMLGEIHYDTTLTSKLKEALSSYFYWTNNQKILIAHCVLFSTKISALIRSIANKIETEHFFRQKYQYQYRKLLEQQRNKSHSSHQSRPLSDEALLKIPVPLKPLSIAMQSPSNNYQLNREKLIQSKYVWQTFQDSHASGALWEEKNDLDENDKYHLNMTSLNELETRKLLDIDDWAPNVWNGLFFGKPTMLMQESASRNDKKNMSLLSMSQITFPLIHPSYLLTLFDLKSFSEDLMKWMWYCNSNKCIYLYEPDLKEWRILGNSLLYDYYYHEFVVKSEMKSNFKKIGVSKKTSLSYWNMHFKDMLNVKKNGLRVNGNWNDLHPKIKRMLVNFLTVPLRDCKKRHELQFLNIIDALEISNNQDKFHIQGCKYVADLLCNPMSRIKILHLFDNGKHYQGQMSVACIFF
ncbi:hypothetical protein RFI_08259 [Reticulomyxa filosa]|uniref:Uncharacterized protein n=1 Tax=Reticulomyxa filosa TaxID=46433 RepID=X6NSE3_RETFI|nr:hypothetical protein RFI_08259 [Reticulomyxa filosa]|eukprot:ETO28858.1 hypothetical protein RFI_08259 [Reticulomyxa filosa]